MGTLTVRPSFALCRIVLSDPLTVVSARDQPQMIVSVHFWSYFCDLAGSPRTVVEIPAGGTVEDALRAVYAAHPRLAPLRNSTLIAVGVEYEGPSRVLQSGEEISLFPPVQGG
jgi:molybdopterin converting factor small subunit